MRVLSSLFADDVCLDSTAVQNAPENGSSDGPTVCNAIFKAAATAIAYADNTELLYENHSRIGLGLVWILALQ